MKKYYHWTAGLLTALLIGANASESSAQRRLYNGFAPYSSVTFGVGSSHYYGDLAGYRRAIRATYIMPRWNVGLGYTRQFTPNFAARAMFTWARIAGDDYTFNKNNPEKYLAQYARNLHFRNDIKEFAITGIYNFVADGRNSNSRAKIAPYVFAGLALVAHSPKARVSYDEENPDLERPWVSLQTVRTESQGQPGRDKPYSLVTAGIPIGIGVRYMINQTFNVGFEVGYRYTFTDYLDDVGSQTYIDRNNLANQPDLFRDLSDRRQQKYASRKNSPTDRYTPLQELYNSRPDLRETIDGILNNPIPRGGTGIFTDGYVLTNFSIQYIIPGKIKCPPVK